MNNDLSHWKRFLEWFCQSDGTGIRLDISRMGFDRSWWDTMQSSMANALVEMEKLESGAVANPDENRMVGHYWLRNPDIAPNDEIREKSRKNLNSLHHFSERVLDGRIKPPNAKRFSRLLLIKDCSEKFNRGVFALNQGLDKILFKPISGIYKSLPSPIKIV